MARGGKLDHGKQRTRDNIRHQDAPVHYDGPSGFPTRPARFPSNCT